MSVSVITAVDIKLYQAKFCAQILLPSITFLAALSLSLSLSLPLIHFAAVGCSFACLLAYLLVQLAGWRVGCLVGRSICNTQVTLYALFSAESQCIVEYTVYV